MPDQVERGTERKVRAPAVHSRSSMTSFSTRAYCNKLSRSYSEGLISTSILEICAKRIGRLSCWEPIWMAASSKHKSKHPSHLSAAMSVKSQISNLSFTDNPEDLTLLHQQVLLTSRPFYR
mmetsp:Transcript_13881/g.29628  ORF Transcript_13881/g.29628 Transcript_13881/m.29628 type:complete len:121 (+) Transcript_13881:4061-4423(+)